MYKTVFWTLWERERGDLWKNGIEICILSYVKQIANPGLMHDTGCLGVVHWDDREGWGGRREGDSGWGTRVHPWRIHVNVCQNQYNIVKKLASN